MDLKFDPIHEQLMLRWRSDGTSCQQTIYLTTTGPNFGEKRREFGCDQSSERCSCPQAVLVPGAGASWRRLVWTSSDRPNLVCLVEGSDVTEPLR